MMSRVFFGELGIPEPDYHLGVGSGSHAWQTGEMMKGIEQVLLREQPDRVVVYGDTNSTLAGALVAAKFHVRIAHVEAGLRSFNRRMPEEINRVLTDHVSSLLFCPTPAAVRNLEREGITRGVELVGDLMYDSIVYYATEAESRSDVLERLGIHSGDYFLATVHRAENTDNEGHLNSILSALLQLSRAETPVVFPAHPRTARLLSKGILGNNHHLIVTEPMSYIDMIRLEKHARAILTDSGGVQKEAFWLSVPCVTMRNETEWIETVESGWNKIVGHDTRLIIAAAISSTRAAKPPQALENAGSAERMLSSLLAN
jgi:UDP-N-acetylglucosamine 2-epimerase